VDRVYTPGELEWVTSEQRRRHGLPMSVAALKQLDDVAIELGAEPGFVSLARAWSR
jgi:hypothetical protein